MLFLLSPRGSSRAGQDERPDRSRQRIRQFIHSPVAPVNTGNVFFVVVHPTEEWQRRNRPHIIIRVFGEAKDPCRPNVIAGDRKVDQEITGKQVSSILGRILVWVDEDVRKRRGCVSNVHLFFKCVQEFPYPPVDDGGVLIVAGDDRAGVHRGEVGLVINHECWNIWNGVIGVHRTQRFGPPGEISQH